MSNFLWIDYDGWDDYVGANFDCPLDEKSAKMLSRVLERVHKQMLREYLEIVCHDIEPYFTSKGLSAVMIDHNANEVLNKQFDLKKTINYELWRANHEIEEVREQIVPYLEGLLEYAKTCEGNDPLYEE